MADFNITVDTHPMADSIDSVNGHVKGVTTAVVAMETAVVAAQEHAAKKISANVDNGFFMLMKSQLSQKIAACKSEMYSKYQLMQTFKKEISRIEGIMDHDYLRIKARYAKHFASLNHALEMRVHELDKSAYELRKVRNQSKISAENDVVKNITYDSESQIVNTQSIAANTKNKSAKSIAVMGENVLETINYNKTLEHILKDRNVQAPSDEYIPVIFVESDSMFAEETSVKNIYVPQTENLDGATLVNNVSGKFQEFPWKSVDAQTQSQIKNIFLEKCGSEGVDERVAKEMIRLFDASVWGVTSKEE
ncbi:hypothetical protein [Treponema zioleckii]|uniref:hypothetical protein n=1 Tax=Treponema zioleckii TaxID=331680 RepID=UPI00168B9A72|nr:hypothetical protein [Treponema zioleckii]